MKVEGLDYPVDREYLHPCASSLLDCAVPGVKSIYEWFGEPFGQECFPQSCC